MSQIHEPKVFGQQSLVNVLGEYIRGVASPGNSFEHEVLLLHSVLDPKVRRGKVANLSETLSPAYTDSRRSVCKYLQSEMESQIFGQRLKTQAVGSAGTYSRELCLGRTQGYSALCL